MPTSTAGYCWWIGLPVLAAVAVLAGLAAGVEIESTRQFLVLVPLFVFGSVLLMTRTLSVVRRSKSSADVTVTVTTVVIAYILVAGVLEAVGLFVVAPFLFEPISEWPGMASVYVPLLLVLLVIIEPLDALGLLDSSSTDGSTDPGEMAANVPVLFDAETGEGLFMSLALTFVVLPALVAVVESSWHGYQITSEIRARKNRLKARKRKFEETSREFNSAIEDAEAALEDDRYDEVERLVIDVAQAKLDRCQRLHKNYDIPESVPASARIENLKIKLKRHEAKQELEDLIQRQEELIEEYRQNRDAANYEKAKGSLRRAKSVASDCTNTAREHGLKYSLPMSSNDIDAAIATLEATETEAELEDIVAEYESHLSTFDDAIWSGDLDRCDTLFETLRQKRSQIEQLEHKLGTNAEALSSADRDLADRIHHAAQQTIRTKFDVGVGTGECDGAFAWPEARARYLLASGRQAAENGEYRDAISRAETVATDLLQHLDDGSPSERNRDSLGDLIGTARDHKGEWERQLIVRQINDAVDREPDEYEEASKILTSALSRIDQTNAFSEEERAIIEQDTRKAYVTVRSDGASALVDNGNERLEVGDESSAATHYEDAMTTLGDLGDTVAEWNDVNNEPIDEQYNAVEQKYVETQTTLLEERIRLGIDQFDADEYDAALETFRNVTNETETVRERVETEYDRLLYLQDLTEANAKTTQRTSLGIGTGSKSLQEPEQDAAGTTHREHMDSSINSTSQAAGAPGNDIFDSIEASLPDEIDYMQLEKETVLGSGGNATVHKARLDSDETQYIALKEPQVPEGTVDKALFDRFRDEAENWKQVDDHPHIVSVLDHGMHTLPWIAMEYLDGGHLGDRVGQLETEHALWTALAVTRAIKHAHRPGITHLDIKPENILFKSVDGYWDIPKVADWGLANHLLDRPDAVEGLSPQYAAPEQFDPDIFGDTDLETDIYQLGVVFYELFTGTLPYEGDRYKVLQNEPERTPTPPSELADVPPELDDVLLKALAPEKADRYENVAFLEQELEVLFESLVNDASPQR
ncbi:protein kinase domain-containing protein [Natronolimnobius baerhuensis]|nr:protein kinase [Natronolimnobius baerhuensis]